FGDDTVGFRDAIATRLAEAFFMGHVADRADLLLDVTRTQPAIAMDTTMQVNKGVCVANSPQALDHLLPRLAQALRVLVSRLDLLLGLGKIGGTFGGRPGPQRLGAVLQCILPL